MATARRRFEALPGGPERTSTKKRSLVENINRRRKAGTSRSKEDSTVSNEAYDRMRKGWPKSAGKTSAKGR